MPPPVYSTIRQPKDRQLLDRRPPDRPTTAPRGHQVGRPIWPALTRETWRRGPGTGIALPVGVGRKPRRGTRPTWQPPSAEHRSARPYSEQTRARTAMPIHDSQTGAVIRIGRFGSWCRPEGLSCPPHSHFARGKLTRPRWRRWPRSRPSWSSSGATTCHRARWRPLVSSRRSAAAGAGTASPPTSVALRRQRVAS